MLKQGMHIDILTDKIFNSKNVKFVLENENENEIENEIELHNRTQRNTNKNKEINPRVSSKTYDRINNESSKRSHETNKKEKLEINNHLIAKNVAAFVTFEYSESMARAIEDCQFYHSSYFKKYPKELKLFENKLFICVPPGPDEIVWEHLEATKFQKIMRRTRTMILSFILLLVCFLATLGANAEQG